MKMNNNVEDIIKLLYNDDSPNVRLYVPDLNFFRIFHYLRNAAFYKSNLALLKGSLIPANLEISECCHHNSFNLGK